jgi:hypothetical protein
MAPACAKPADPAAAAPSGAQPAPALADTLCAADTDCAFGEIDHEIVSKSDCPCLFGCETRAQNVKTRTRRTSQYKMLCEPGKDGSGERCPADDCVSGMKEMCDQGHCVVLPR